MAKRIFEIAKELDIPSKAILDKCRAEGIPNMNNHMSAVSAGLEATIREWFAGAAGSGGASAEHEHAAHAEASHDEGGVATAVETAPQAPIAKAKARPRPKGETDHPSALVAAPAVAPAAAAAPATHPSIATPAPPAPQAPPAPGRPTTTGPTIVRPAPVAPPAPAAPAPPPAPDRAGVSPAPPPPPPARPSPPVPAGPRQPLSPISQAPINVPASRVAPPPAPPTGQPRPHVPDAQQDHGPSGPTGGQGQGPPRPQHAKPAVVRPEPPRTPPVMNVPNRPKVVAPAGPRLQVQAPIKLSGPKVVRIEAPDVVEAPRPRGPRTGGPPGAGQLGSAPRTGGVRTGQGVGGGAPAGGTEDDKNRARNKRRAPVGGPATTRRGKADESPGSFNWREQDLAEREERLARAGGFLRQRRRDSSRPEHTGERAISAARTGGVVTIVAPFSIKDLSAATGVKASDIVKKLFMQGVVASVNSGIETAKAQEIMIDYNIDLQITEEVSAEEAVSEKFADREAIDLRPRSPVVTILGHVDHGKTSLLDKIRSANVAAGEAGGITQKTSAFRVPVEINGATKHVVFLDTPGHEAFTAMRARGANMTDVVVLVVAADDGVMPQTSESINHAKAAGVPIVVALNKIDKPEATEGNIRKIFGQLAERGLNPVEWGGETEVIKTSATQGTGVKELLETLEYQTELLELKADFEGPARGIVIESRMEEGRGPTADVLVQNGRLKVGDFVVAGRSFGKVRDVVADGSARIKSAEPAMPVRISGLDQLPDAGDRLFVVESLKEAQEAAEQRRQREREKELAAPKVTLDSILSQLKEGDVKELLVVVKADVQGSVDVLKKAIEEVATSEVKVKVLHAAVGGINESDVLLAAASRAVIVGFNVIGSGKARQLAEQKSVEIRTYQVIYDIVDDIKKAAAGLLAPELRYEILGHAEVRQVFRVTRVGAIAGCYVTDGTVERNALIRVTRGGIVVENDRVLEQLKRFKDDAKEVRAGQECGMKIVGYDDIKEGDIIECYRKTEVRRTL